MGRTVIVGDVHGCAAELDDLLARVGFGEADRLVSVGDLVARGPEPAAVVRRLRELAGRAVVGNHEQRLLAARAARARGEPGPKLGPSQERVLVELDLAAWHVLEALPLWLDLPEHGLRVVHAGVVPGLAIGAQDPWVLTHLRTIRSDGSPSSERESRLWGELYTEAPHVVFGHNAVDGLQLHSRATGLDTGCVYGGALSALVLADAQPLPPPNERRDLIVSVRARRAYCEMKPG